MTAFCFSYGAESRVDIWTDIELRALTCLYNNNVPIRDISWFLCRSYSGVKYQIYKHKLSNRSVSYTESDFHVIKKFAGEKTAAYISSLINHPLHSVLVYGARKGVSFMRYGDNAYNVKYSDSDVLLMRALYDEGLRICDIAFKFEICQHVVRNLLFRRSVSADYYLKSEVKGIRYLDD